MVRAVQFAVYTVVALVLGYCAYEAVMWEMYGAPASALYAFGIVGAGILFCGGVASLANPPGGRITALIGIAVMGLLWIPEVESLVPESHTVVSLLAYVISGLYFIALGTVMLFPKRWRWGFPIFCCICLAVGTIFATTLVSRDLQGTYDEPAFIFFLWHPGSEGLTIDIGEPFISPEARSVLEAAGIRGALEYKAQSGDSRNHIVYILATSQPPGSYDIHYPRGQNAVYAFDGNKWLTSPAKWTGLSHIRNP